MIGQQGTKQYTHDTLNPGDTVDVGRRAAAIATEQERDDAAATGERPPRRGLVGLFARLLGRA